MWQGTIRDGELEEYFRAELAEEEIIYVPNFGNAGDALIGLGTLEFFDRLGVRWRLANGMNIPRGRTVVFAGGGALIGRYPRSERSFAGLLERGNHVVVLPHTITRLDELLLRYGRHLTIFARERTTREYLRGFPGIRHLGLDHDMAFHLAGDLEGFRNGSARARLLPALCEGSPHDRLRVVKRLPRALRARRRVRKLAKSGPDPVLNCFREDVERSGRPLPPDNLDLSQECALGTESMASTRLSAHELMSALSRFDTIRTDRLHCCIGALLLGLRVDFHGNNYHKNESVFRHSIKGLAPGVFWNPPA